MSLSIAAASCAPGYMRADELERKEQGPKQCAERCEQLGMKMGALVLVGNDLPGCVCQPRGAPLKPSAQDEGASAATTGYVVLAAAAAARQRQLQQQQQTQRQQSYAAH